MAERAEDLNLPNAVVTRLIKDALPDGINIGKEARTAIARAASVYVIYVTSVASNIAKRECHKTITAQYILDAIEEIEFESFIEPLKEALEAFRKSSKDRKDKKKEETDKKDDTVEEENSNVIVL